MHCLLWHKRGEAPARELLDALARKGMTPRAVHVAFEAMAGVCAGSRGGPAGRGVLILVEPRGLAGAGEVVRAIEKYGGAARCARFEAGSNRRLRPVVEEDVAEWLGERPREEPEPEFREDRPAATPERITNGWPLRLAGEGSMVESPVEQADAGGEPTAPRELLTAEELAVLLGDDPGSGRAGRS